MGIHFSAQMRDEVSHQVLAHGRTVALTEGLEPAADTPPSVTSSASRPAFNRPTLR